jgi:hypothetical protein
MITKAILIGNLIVRSDGLLIEMTPFYFMGISVIVEIQRHDRFRTRTPVGQSLGAGVHGMEEQNCRHCARFVDDPAAIEQEFPGLNILGSVYASVRGNAGICRELDRFMDPIPAADCPTFVPRGDARTVGTR